MVTSNPHFLRRLLTEQKSSFNLDSGVLTPQKPIRSADMRFRTHINENRFFDYVTNGKKNPIGSNAFLNQRTPLYYNVAMRTSPRCATEVDIKFYLRLW